MAKKARPMMYFDKTELVMNAWTGKGYASFTMTNDQILRISFERYERTRFKFFKYPDERLVIHTTKFPNPLMLTKKDNAEVYDGHKEELLEYAKKYRIRVDDLTDKEIVSSDL